MSGVGKTMGQKQHRHGIATDGSGADAESSSASGAEAASPPAASEAPTMAVSIAGVSMACSKRALVSSAKAVRESLSNE